MSPDNRGLFIFVEGTDDERFFETLVKPKLEGSYAWVTLQRYSQTSWRKTKSLIHNLPKIGAEYILIADIDDCPCVTIRKQKIKEKLPIVEEERIVVVIKEIESWYLAGLDSGECEALSLPEMPSTENVDKEQFNRLIPGLFDSRIDFMVEILKRFASSVAKSKNTSFKYFCEKYCE